MYACLCESYQLIYRIHDADERFHSVLSTQLEATVHAALFFSPALLAPLLTTAYSSVSGTTPARTLIRATSGLIVSSASRACQVPRPFAILQENSERIACLSACLLACKHPRQEISCWPRLPSAQPLACAGGMLIAARAFCAFRSADSRCMGKDSLAQHLPVVFDGFTARVCARQGMLAISLSARVNIVHCFQSCLVFLFADMPIET
jgi:hypothetical protein